MKSSIPVIFSCKGLTLTESERSFFQKSNPVGLILFSRNCESPVQVQDLIRDFKELVSSPAPLILIDQEGGRVQRLGPPNWPVYPPPARVAELGNFDPAIARKASYLLGRLLASDLRPLGFNVNCAPVLDVLQAETHNIIGDRAFGNDALRVSILGRALCDGLLAGGVLPVIKHMPGHGRAYVDSHTELPNVDAPKQELENVDFVPFRALRDMPLAMTAHVVFKAFDSQHPVTTSARAIRQILRGWIGYKGLIVSDDITMKALSGGMQNRARDAQRAGCDLILHCSGILSEMELVAGAVQKTSRAVEMALARAEVYRKSTLLEDGFDPNQGRAQLSDTMAAMEI